jgi:hypothetical protein
MCPLTWAFKPTGGDMLEPFNDDSKCAYNEYIVVKNVYTYAPAY